MANCRRIKFLFKFIPVKSLQYSLLQGHLLKCDVCQKELASVEEAHSATFHKDRLEEMKDFWPQFLKSLETEKQRRRPFLHPVWRWTMGAVGAVALTLVFIVVLTHSPQKESIDTSIKLTIDYVKIYEEPAQAIIFQTQDANRTFVWVEKQLKGEMQ
jgi:hypothetical protein